MRVLGYLAAGYLVLTILVGMLATPGMFLFFLGAALVWLVPRLVASVRTRAWRPAARALPVAGLLLITGWAGGLLIVLRQELVSGSGFATRFTRATLPSRPPPGDDLELARDYEPLFIFSQDEGWFPSSVETYLRSAVLRSKGRSVERPTAASLSACTEQCYVTIKCDGYGDDGCVRDRPGPSVVYARVLRAGRGDMERRIFDRPLPFSDLTTIIQYWVFYRYNDWVSWWGGFREWHEADWEAITVGLSPTRPLFAAYASHCGGEWREWKRLGGAAIRRDREGRWIAEPNPGRGPHPLAFVAEGGHAAYPDNVYRSPNFLSCPPGAGVRTASLVAGPTFGSGVRETMEHIEGREDLLRVPRVELVDDRTDFMRFRGRWAPSSVARLLLKKSRARGPQSPSDQDLWIDPVWTIFCKEHWSPDDHCPAGLHRIGPS